MANAKNTGKNTAPKGKVTPKKKKQYTMVSFECEELFDGELELPDLNQLPASIAVAMSSGKADVKDVAKFFEFLDTYGSEGILDVFDSLEDEDAEAFFKAWEKASSSKAPKSEKSDN